MHESEVVLDAKYENSYEQRRLAILEELMPKGEGDRALDLGCGSGIISEMLRDHDWCVTAVDLNSGNVERAKAKGFLAIEGDVIGAVRSFPDAQFGIVCATELIEHLDEEYRGELLSEAFRVVYPGGYLLLSTPNRMSPDGLYGYYYRELIRGVRYTAWDDTHNRIYSSFEIRNALKRAGWQIARTVGYHYGSHGVSLPIEASDHFPLNRFGFDTMVLCRRAD